MAPNPRDLDVLFLADEIPPVVSGRSHLVASIVRRQPADGTYLISGTPGSSAVLGVDAHVHRVPALLARFGGGLARERHRNWILGRRRPDLVVACGLGDEATAARALKEQHGIPYLLHVEAPALATARRKIREGGADGARFLRLFDEAASLVTASGACRLEAYKCGVLPQQLDVVPVGVDLERFRPGEKSAALAKKLKAERGPVLLTVVGRGPAKDLETVYRAFAVLRGQRRSAVLIVVGADERREKKAVKEARVERHVRFLPRVEPQEMPELYRLADAYLTAHRERHAEWIVAGVEVAIVEALASGLPVFGTRAAITEELAPPEEVGMLVEAEAHQKLGRLVAETLKDSELTAEYAQEARARAERLHSDVENGAAFRELLSVIHYRRLGRSAAPPANDRATERNAA
ncbi:MAG: glycosyltransferase family 4 protein [bacterium]